MANVKYLSYDGLKHYDEKLKDFILRGFANGISVTQNEENNTIDLTANYKINNVATSSILATAQINLATTSKAGLMSKDDKAKLNSIETGGEVNQNAFSNVVVDTTTISAAQKTDTLNIVSGDNITLTTDAENNKITIAATDTTYADGDCITIGEDNKINHDGFAVTTTKSSTTGTHGGKFIAVTSIERDDFGHIKSINVATHTYPADWTKIDFYATSVHPATETASEYAVVTEIKDATHTANKATATGQYTTVKVPSKKYVDDQISASFKANDAMIYKGTVSKDADLPYTACNIGWTYRVDTAGTYAGQECEVGDMIICLTEGTTSVTGTWNVINTNVDGAVYNTSDTSTKDNFVAFDSTTGKLIKDSGFNSDSFATATHGHIMTVNGEGDDVITVTPETGGDLTVGYGIKHKKYTSATFTQSATSAKPGTSIKFNVPTFTVDSYGHVENVASSAITVTIPAYPTSLKNPNSITVKWNNESNTSQTIEYNGSATKEVDLTKGIYYAATTSTAQYSVTSGNSVTAGNAGVAGKLSTSTGSTTKPVYFKDGKPTQCSFTVETSVPANAIFDDTLNTAGSTALLDTKLFIVGAKNQAASDTTYSNTNTYIGSDNKLYAIGSTSTTVTSVITCNDAITNGEIDELF